MQQFTHSVSASQVPCESVLTQRLRLAMYFLTLIHAAMLCEPDRARPDVKTAPKSEPFVVSPRPREAARNQA